MGHVVCVHACIRLKMDRQCLKGYFPIFNINFWRVELGEGILYSIFFVFFLNMKTNCNIDYD